MQEGVNHKKRRCSPLPRSQSHPGNAAFTGGLRRKRIHVIFRYNHSISRSPCPCPGAGPCPTPCEISLHFSVQNERTTGRVKAISSGAPFRPPTRCCLSILCTPPGAHFRSLSRSLSLSRCPWLHSPGLDAMMHQFVICHYCFNSFRAESGADNDVRRRRGQTRRKPRKNHWRGVVGIAQGHESTAKRFFAG